MSHSYSNNYVHAIYSTKNRENLIPTEFEKRIYSFIASTAREHHKKVTFAHEFLALLKKAGVP